MLPTFEEEALPKSLPEVLTDAHAAARLELHAASFRKLKQTGIFGSEISSSVVEELRSRKPLRVRSGELTVLRTDAKAPAYAGEDRKYLGFHVDFSDEELADASLKWWRGNVEGISNNRLFAVTIAGFPMAVYQIVGCIGSITREGERRPRYAFAGQLLARVGPNSPTIHFPQNANQFYFSRARQIMESRVITSSGGPIGYLSAAR